MRFGNRSLNRHPFADVLHKPVHTVGFGTINDNQTLRTAASLLDNRTGQCFRPRKKQDCALAAVLRNRGDIKPLRCKVIVKRFERLYYLRFTRQR